MKELTLAFENCEDAKYYYRSLIVEYENTFFKKGTNMLVCNYQEYPNSFADKVLTFLGIKKPVFNSCIIYFKSKNSILKGYKNILYIKDNNIDISVLHDVILKECRKNG